MHIAFRVPVLDVDDQLEITDPELFLKKQALGYVRLKFVGLGPILVGPGRNATVTRREFLATGGFFGAGTFIVHLFNVFINKLEVFTMNRLIFVAALITAVAAIPVIAATSWTGTSDVQDGAPHAMFSNSNLHVELACNTQGTKLAVQVVQRGKAPSGTLIRNGGGVMQASEAWSTLRSMVPSEDVPGLEPLARKFFADACSIKA